MVCLHLHCLLSAPFCSGAVGSSVLLIPMLQPSPTLLIWALLYCKFSRGRITTCTYVCRTPSLGGPLILTVIYKEAAPFPCCPPLFYEATHTSTHPAVVGIRAVGHMLQNSSLLSYSYCACSHPCSAAMEIQIITSRSQNISMCHRFFMKHNSLQAV